MTDRPAGPTRSSVDDRRPAPRAPAFALMALAVLGCGEFPDLLPYVDLGPRPASEADAADMSDDLDATPVDATRTDGDVGVELDVEIDQQTPTDEVCDGRDNDLDGQTDEDIEATPCQDGQGECLVTGQRVCRGGALVCDAQAGEPTDELCNGLDDDCDTYIDEDFEGLGQACTVSEGVCQGTGRIECEADGSGTRCTAVEIPGVRAIEICDGLDNDCDGVFDEAEGSPETPVTMACIPEGGSGQCAVGVTACAAAEGSMEATWGACTPLGPSPSELCNGLDDDCDGRVDEGIRDVNRIGQNCVLGLVEPPLDGCLGARYECSADETQVACVAPAETTCDGIDENCDGVIDDGLGCGEALADGCRAWLGWTQRDIGDMVEMWGACPERADWSDTLSCNGAPAPAGPFAEISIGGDVDDDADRLGVSWRCGGDDPVTAFAQRSCRIYLGAGPANGAPADPSPTWGPCPDEVVGTQDTVSCTSGDGLFRPMPLLVDIDESAVLSVAFRCSAVDGADLLPEGWAAGRLAERLEQSIEVFIAWADADVAGGEIDWEAVCAPGGDGNSATTCVSSGGDGQFHTLRFISDLDSQDRLAIGLRPRAIE